MLTDRHQGTETKRNYTRLWTVTVCTSWSALGFNRVPLDYRSTAAGDLDAGSLWRPLVCSGPGA
jgi:hypothetical protein